MLSYESFCPDFEKIGVFRQTLIIEGKIEKPQIVYGFSSEDRKEFDLGITWEHVFGNKRNNIH